MPGKLIAEEISDGAAQSVNIYPLRIDRYRGGKQLNEAMVF